jgi:hypothetical protein
VNERGTIKLDASKKPAWIDLTITEGADAGKLQVGVIEVTGNVSKTSRAPFRPSRAQRPKLSQFRGSWKTERGCLTTTLNTRTALISPVCFDSRWSSKTLPR